MARGIKYTSNTPLQVWRRYVWRRVPHFERTKHPHDWHWVVAGIGKTMIVIGLLIFAFVGYQLWGTGIQTAQAQNRLEDEFRAKLEATTTVVPTSTTTTTTVVSATTVPGATTTTIITAPPTSTIYPIAPPSEPIPGGEPIATMRIPAIGLNWAVVEGVTVADLKDGPGHFRETVMPGQLGNSAIAGHRTTNGNPFLELDELKPGALIEITTLVGTYTYKVTESLIVNPSEYGLVIPTVDPTIATLVLVTCDPVYTARNRLIVKATLVPERSGQVYAPPPTTVPTSTTVGSLPDEETTTSIGAIPDPTETTIGVTTGSEAAESGDAFTDGWFSDLAAIPHVLGWGVLLFAVGIGAYFAGRAANRLYVCFLVGLVPFTFVLYFWFENVSRLLPPGL